MGPRELSRAFAFETFPLVGLSSPLEEAAVLFRARAYGLDTSIVRSVWRSLRSIRATRYAA